MRTGSATGKTAYKAAFRAALLFATIGGLAVGQNIAPPRIWKDRELEKWATPVAGLNVRPTHFSEQEYYAAPIGEFVRTYPVYFPGREPEGYWEALQNRRPQPLVVSGPRTKQQWINAGTVVFRELDTLPFRSYDPELISLVRSAEAFRKVGGRAQADGTVSGMRWVPTSKGLALSILDCAGCHTRLMPDGSFVDGAPLNMPGNGVIGQLIARGTQPLFGEEGEAIGNWRAFAVPWVRDDIHSRIREMAPQQLGALLRLGTLGVFPRFNGSPYFPTKIPDLIGISDRRYLDHTATHRNRSSVDVARYAALVTCCDKGEFGSHRMLNAKQSVILRRYPDDVLFALGEYIYSLAPPRNPHTSDSRVSKGKQLFEEQGCGRCHTPPVYTNNKLTLAVDYATPKKHPLASDIMPLSVGTDPGLALQTRKGTGLYKVPSLRGVWYRGLYGHDGSVTSLEDWFDARRLRDDYVPSGFKGHGVKTRAVKGHEFGLTLSEADKAALIAFLKSL